MGAIAWSMFGLGGGGGDGEEGEGFGVLFARPCTDDDDEMERCCDNGRIGIRLSAENRQV